MQEPKKGCNGCEFWGECDHQGAYHIDGKWCYDKEEKEPTIECYHKSINGYGFCNDCGIQNPPYIPLPPKEKEPEIDYKQCDNCDWTLSNGCSQQVRRPKKGDNCPTYKPKEQDFVNLVDILKELLHHVEDHCETKSLTDTWKRQQNAFKISKMLGGEKPPKRKDGCYQFTYCSECMAYPMGLGCPNIVKGPIQLKDEVKNKYYDGETWGKE